MTTHPACCGRWTGDDGGGLSRRSWKRTLSAPRGDYLPDGPPGCAPFLRRLLSSRKDRTVADGLAPAPPPNASRRSCHPPGGLLTVRIRSGARCRRAYFPPTGGSRFELTVPAWDGFPAACRGRGHEWRGGSHTTEVTQRVGLACGMGLWISLWIATVT